MSARLLSIEEVAALLDMSSRRVVDTYEKTGKLTPHRVYGKAGVKHGYSAIEVAELLKIEPKLLDRSLLQSLIELRRSKAAEDRLGSELVNNMNNFREARRREADALEKVKEATALMESWKGVAENLRGNMGRAQHHSVMELKTQVSELEQQLSQTVDALNHATQRADACEDTIARQNAQWSTKLQAAELANDDLYSSREAVYKGLRRERLRADRYEVALAIVAIGALAAAVLWWLP